MFARGTLAHVDPVSEQVEHFPADFFEFQAEIHQHLGRDTFVFPEQPEQNVFGPDVVVVQISRFLHGVFDDLFGARSLRQAPHGHQIGAATDQFLDFEPDFAQIDIQIFEHVRGNAAPFLDKAEQNMLGSDIFMIESLSFLVGQLHHLPCAVGKSFVRHFILVGCDISSV